MEARRASFSIRDRADNDALTRDVACVAGLVFSFAGPDREIEIVLPAPPHPIRLAGFRLRLPCDHGVHFPYSAAFAACSVEGFVGFFHPDFFQCACCCFVVCFPASRRVHGVDEAPCRVTWLR
jgi:hypothetical protein